MSTVRFLNGAVLFVGGQVAFDDDCCCCWNCAECCYSKDAVLHIEWEFTLSGTHSCGAGTHSGSADVAISSKLQWWHTEVFGTCSCSESEEFTLGVLVTRNCTTGQWSASITVAPTDPGAVGCAAGQAGTTGISGDCCGFGETALDTTEFNITGATLSAAITYNQCCYDSETGHCAQGESDDDCGGDCV